MRRSGGVHRRIAGSWAPDDLTERALGLPVGTAPEPPTGGGAEQPRRQRGETVRVHTMLLAVFLTGCTHPGADVAPPSGAQDVLAAGEIERSNAGTLHEAIERLRPQYLLSRGRASMRAPNSLLPVVFVDNVPQASIESLRGISARDVQYVRFLSAADATTRYGTGYMAGVIEVVLK